MSDQRETDGDSRTERTDGPSAGPARRWILILAVALLGLEFGLRGLSDFGRTRITVGHSDLGWVHLPDQDAIDTDGVSMHINSHGYRDLDWAEPAAAERTVREGGRDGTRIAVLGDSVAFGFRMDAEDRWPDRLHTRVLSGFQIANDNLVTMNFAVPGYGLEQMVTCYEQHVRAWRPNYVIVDFHDAAIRPMLPIGRERLPLERWLARTALADAWRTRIRRFGSEGQGAPRSVHESVVRAAVQTVLADPFGPGTNAMWAQGRERLLALRDRVAADGGELIVLFTPLHRHFAAKDAPRAALHLAPFLRDAGIPSLDLHDVVLEDLGGDAFFDATSTDASLLDTWFLAHDPEHLTVRAHDRIAFELQAMLQSLFLLELESD